MTQEKSEPAPLDPAHIPNDSSDSSNDKYLHGLSLVFMTLSLMAGVFTLALDNCIIGWQPIWQDLKLLTLICT